MTVVHTPHSIAQVGLARCDITPPVGAYHRMWGAAKHDRSTGVHRPLTATALALQAIGAADGKSEIVYIDVDHCLFWAPEMDAVLTALCQRTGLAREQFLVAFTHTHGAGLMDSTRSNLPGGDLIAPYLEKTAGQLADLVEKARANRQEATLTYTQGRCDLAQNRDLWDEKTKQIVCGYNPAGPADDTVQIVRITASSGKPIAVVVNYACHPTTLAYDNTMVSPDYVGALRETVEATAGAPCVFLQGASGDLGPKEGFVGNPAIADRNGRQLAFAVLSALEALPAPGTFFRFQGPVISGATLGPWEHVPLSETELAGKRAWTHRFLTVPLPYRPEIPTIAQVQADRAEWVAKEAQAKAAGEEIAMRDARAMIERKDRLLVRLKTLVPGTHFPFPVTILKIGDAFWIGVEGEHYQILQTRLREKLPGVPLVVTTLVNGSRCFYLVPKETYGKGIYQETVCVLAPGTLESLIDAIGAALKEMA